MKFSLYPILCSTLVVSALAADAVNMRPAASVNGELISEEQLEAAARTQLAPLEDRIRQVRQAVLNKLIDNALVNQSARAAGLTTEEYLRVHVESVSVSDTEVERAYGTSRDQFNSALPAEARYRIRRTLEDNARAAAMNSLLDQLRRQAHVTNHLALNAMTALNAAAHEGPSMGNPQAPVTVVEFSDFECPYCRAAQKFIDKAIQRWPGKVRLVFKHFPLDQHPNAMRLAKATVCADRQGRFWELHNRIFSTSGSLDEVFLRSASANSGLRMSDYDSCMARDEVVDQVRKDIMLARLAGVEGTPAFFVNGQLISSSAALEPAIERILEGQQ